MNDTAAVQLELYKMLACAEVHCESGLGTCTVDIYDIKTSPPTRLHKSITIINVLGYHARELQQKVQLHASFGKYC